MAGACEQPAVPVPLIEGCKRAFQYNIDIPFFFWKIQVIMLHKTALLDISTINVSHYSLQNRESSRTKGSHRYAMSRSRR